MGWDITRREMKDSQLGGGKKAWKGGILRGTKEGIWEGFWEGF